MTINLTGFKATTEIKPSSNMTIEAAELRETLQTLCDVIAVDDKRQIAHYWSMVSYKHGAQHNKDGVAALSGIILEYDKRYESDLLNALMRADFPFQYLLVETERKNGLSLSLFFPLAFEPSVNDYLRLAGVLAYQIGVYGLSKGSGTPTFLVKLVGGQTVGEHAGPAINRSYIAETKDIGDGSKTALEDFQGPKPVEKINVGASIDTRRNLLVTITNTGAPIAATKQEQIAAHFRKLADLFDPE